MVAESSIRHGDFSFLLELPMDLRMLPALAQQLFNSLQTGHKLDSRHVVGEAHAFRGHGRTMCWKNVFQGYSSLKSRFFAALVFVEELLFFASILASNKTFCEPPLIRFKKIPSISSRNFPIDKKGISGIVCTSGGNV